MNNKKEEFSYNNIYDRVYDSHIHNMGIKHFDWNELENTNSTPLINNGNKIINENLFKNYCFFIILCYYYSVFIHNIIIKYYKK